MSDTDAIKNPFPGPQPYRAADRHRFYGRDALVTKLTNQILARPLTTLFGPSGSGKSSLMQAGVIPRLEEAHDFLVVRVDAWPPGEAPLSWLVRALFTDLELGAPPADKSSLEALDEAMSLAERRSERPTLIYLDQLEQLFFPERAEAEAEAVIDGIDRLARAPIQGLQIVLSLREDYLGRFRDRARDRKSLLSGGFRLGPLTVGEMVKAVCRAASEGQPPQSWDEEQLSGVMMGVRTPGERASSSAEVQAAYAQIVCRALFQERALKEERGVIEAEPILRRYLDATLDGLGPLGPEARRLLEDHLVTADGSRTLRTEKELLRIIAAEKLAPILKALEGAAILHVEAHQGSRYFEIGHDWLAKRVSDRREQRERDAERALELAKARAQRRALAIVAAISVVMAVSAGALALRSWWQERAAKEAALCPEGASICDGNTPRSCHAGRWQSQASCVAGTCSEGRCVGECVAGVRRCANNTPQICGALGEWKSEPSCGAPKHCQGGACVVSCAPEVDVGCFGNTPYTCDVNGSFHPGEACKASTCIEGACKGACALGAARCSAAGPGVPETCDATGQWRAHAPCAKACVAGSCPGASCEGLPESCGPAKNESCCLSPPVLGGTYNRTNNPRLAATVSDFRLDRFEITVGRFRRFVEAYPGSKPQPGAGGHPRIQGRGWEASWAGQLPATQAALRAAVKCSPGYETWTDKAGANEALPMNCIDWVTSFAFCAWDGGRLPTEAEWNYAAAGGGEQRSHPWLSPASSQEIDATYALYGCMGDGDSKCAFNDIGSAGSRSPKGDGKWGQADLAGSMWEWTLDENIELRANEACTDCANTSFASVRVIRGGSWPLGASNLLTSGRYSGTPTYRYGDLGARCARAL